VCAFYRFLCFPCDVPTKAYPVLLVLMFSIFGPSAEMYTGLAAGYICKSTRSLFSRRAVCALSSLCVCHKCTLLTLLLCGGRCITVSYFTAIHPGLDRLRSWQNRSLLRSVVARPGKLAGRVSRIQLCLQSLYMSNGPLHRWYCRLCQCGQPGHSGGTAVQSVPNAVCETMRIGLWFAITE